MDPGFRRDDSYCFPGVRANFVIPAKAGIHARLCIQFLVESQCDAQDLGLRRHLEQYDSLGFAFRLQRMFPGTDVEPFFHSVEEDGAG